MKIVQESRKILGLPDLKITSTTVRVPVIYGHSEAVSIEFERPLTPQEAREVLSSAPGIVVMDDPAELLYPLPQALAAVMKFLSVGFVLITQFPMALICGLLLTISVKVLPPTLFRLRKH